VIANDLIKSALRKLVVIPSGETPSTNQYADGLSALNDIVGSWSAVKDLVYEDTLEELTIPVSTQSFTIGTTGDQTTSRPTEIIQVSLKDSDGTEYPLTSMDSTTYAQYANKSIATTPSRYYYRKTYPNGTFYFNCTTEEEYTLVLTSMKELTQFADGTTDYALPKHYERALKQNLTIEIAPEMGAAKRVTKLMVMQAEESKQVIIGNAVKVNVSQTELSGRGSYSINSG
jgi:hypothetical protein